MSLITVESSGESSIWFLIAVSTSLAADVRLSATTEPKYTTLSPKKQERELVYFSE